ncbi:MAG: SDR family oxidoreductase [Planctomycetes bacterium]|nr:SDR family oxidoreductase [Planctomycetota bacterium]MBM4057997.1 SDR family oxidoreductase [Planctomycetota bacterium]
MTRRVLIIGGGGGIGSALARLLVAGGGRVFLAGRNADRVNAIAAELDATSAVVDASDPDAVDACADQAAEALGGLSGIACCAGSLLLKPAHLTSAAEWQSVIAANLTSGFGCVRAAGRLLKADGGSVVLVSSAAARIGLANHEAIAAAKAGLIGLMVSAAATYARQRIRFNAVAPGLVRTPLTRGLVSSEVAEKASVGMHPLGRLGEPDDVARAIAFLLDPAQDWITGQVLGVDGGLATIKVRQA